MTIRHHVSDALLLDYATGSLGEGWSIAVASHLALCPSCRKRLTLMESAGGALFSVTHAAPSDGPAIDDSWARMRARLLDKPDAGNLPSAPSPAMKSPVAPTLPEPLRSYVGGDVDTLQWRSLGRGAYHLPIATGDKSTSVRLLRIPAGGPVPEHGHRGRELTLVLAGSFHDETGVFARGDFEEADEDLEHQPVAMPGADCICLAVTDAPLRFRSWVVRLAQPFLGI
ncbi:MAG: cupin domain-containing protein [Rhodobiaceae bacterium]|nr:ChrR family anti-sigma-E factor [Rhodobiaceae bacterium]MCC0056540.1 cupin domain-containing protein [Rhodobiaceae bacterium]